MPSVPKVGMRAPVEGDQSIPGCHVEDAFLFAIGPVGEAAAGQLSRRRPATLALVFTVDPEQLAGLRIERHNRATRPSG